MFKEKGKKTLTVNDAYTYDASNRENSWTSLK